MRYKLVTAQGTNPAVLQWLYNSALITKGSRRPQFRLVPIVLYINYQLLMKTLTLRTGQQLLNITFFRQRFRVDVHLDLIFFDLYLLNWSRVYQRWIMKKRIIIIHYLFSRRMYKFFKHRHIHLLSYSISEFLFQFESYERNKCVNWYGFVAFGGTET